MSLVIGGLRINGSAGGRAFSFKEPCRLATSSNININNDLDVGQQLDSVTITANDRILVRNQNNPTENGIYIVRPGNTASNIRSYDYDEGDDVSGSIISVTDGALYQNTTWINIQSTGSGKVGTNQISFEQMSGNGVDGNVNYIGGASSIGAIPRIVSTNGMSIDTTAVLVDASANMTGIGDISIGGVIQSAETNILGLDNTPSAVNYLSISNGTTGISPVLSSIGNDTDIDLNFQAKGAGVYNFLNTGSTVSTIVLYDTTGVNDTAIIPSATASRTLTLPDKSGTVALTSDITGGSGEKIIRVNASSINTSSYSVKDRTFLLAGTITKVTFLTSQPSNVNNHRVRVFDTTANSTVAGNVAWNNETITGRIYTPNYTFNTDRIFEIQSSRNENVLLADPDADLHEVLIYYQ